MNERVDKKVNSMVSSLYLFLKSRATNTSLKEEDFANTSGSIYDTITKKFFNESLALKELKEKEIGDLRFQHQLLYGIDKSLDLVPEDSMFFVSADRSFEVLTQEEKELLTSERNKYVAGYLIKGKLYPLLNIKMDDSGKFIYILPFIYFDQSLSKDIDAFIARQKKDLEK